MSLKCPWCDKHFEIEGSVVRHASRIHHKKRRDYDLTTKYNDVVPLCSCGCGEEVTYSQHANCFNRFVHSHQQRDPEIRQLMIESGRATGNDPEERLRRSITTKEWWANPENIISQQHIKETWVKALHEGHKNVRDTEEYRTNLSAQIKKKWTEEWGADKRAQCATPEFREAVSIGTKKALDNDAVRNKLSILASKNQANGIIGPNMTKRSWVINPFTGNKEHFDSGWEVSLLNEAVIRNVPIKRNKERTILYMIDKRQHRYTPDFVSLSGMTLIEVKGMKLVSDEIKISAGIEFCKENNMTYVLFDTVSSFINEDLWSQIK